jgi:hypothetical protein
MKTPFGETSMSDQPQTSEISNFSVLTRDFSMQETVQLSQHIIMPPASACAPMRRCTFFQTRLELQLFFQEVAGKYYAEGQRGSRYINLDVKLNGSKSVFATMDWQMLREDGSTIRAWRQSYNLMRPDGRWQILVSTMHV